MPAAPPTQRPASDPGRLLNVRLSSIDPSPTNPRLKLRDVEELAASIAAYGLLQPLVVRPAGKRYTLLVGHRRLAAIQSLGWTQAPAFAREADDDEAHLLTLIENLQRSDLSPREEAQALEVLLREHGWTTRQVAGAVHRSPAYVSKRLRVFEDPVLAPLVLQQQLSTSAAEELLVLPMPERKALAQQATAGELGTRRGTGGGPREASSRSTGRRRCAAWHVNSARTCRASFRPSCPTRIDASCACSSRIWRVWRAVRRSRPRSCIRHCRNPTLPEGHRCPLPA